MVLARDAQRTSATLLPLLILSLALLGAEARAQTSLTTNYTGNTGSSCNMFEIKSLTGSLITGFDIHFTGTATFEVWTLNMTGTYLGNETSNANWTLQGTAPNLVSLGMTTATPMGLNLNIPIPAGVTQSVYITVTAAGGATVWYNAGLTQGTLHAGNSDMEVYVGNAGSYFNATIVGRGWNGTVYYTPLATVNDDMSLDALTAPTGQDLNCSAILTAAETVSGSSWLNTGFNTVAAGSTLLLSYQIDGGPVITEAALLATALGTGQTLAYNFATTADFSTPGPHSVVATVSYALDLDSLNDSLTETVSNGPPQVATYPLARPSTRSRPRGMRRRSVVPRTPATPAATSPTGRSRPRPRRPRQAAPSRTPPEAAISPTSMTRANMPRSSCAAPVSISARSSRRAELLPVEQQRQPVAHDLAGYVLDRRDLAHDGQCHDRRLRSGGPSRRRLELPVPRSSALVQRDDPAGLPGRVRQTGLRSTTSPSTRSPSTIPFRRPARVRRQDWRRSTSTTPATATSSRPSSRATAPTTPPRRSAA